MLASLSNSTYESWPCQSSGYFLQRKLIRRLKSPRCWSAYPIEAPVKVRLAWITRALSVMRHPNLTIRTFGSLLRLQRAPRRTVFGHRTYLTEALSAMDALVHGISGRFKFLLLLWFLSARSRRSAYGRYCACLFIPSFDTRLYPTKSSNAKLRGGFILHKDPFVIHKSFCVVIRFYQVGPI